MADIRRQVGDINVTRFINPGVEDNSASALLGALGQGALNIDQVVAENKLQKELEDMRTIYETSGFALTGGQPPAGLTEQDVKEISQEKDRLGRLSRAVQQGTMSIGMYRVTAEAALRAAIARRPGLAQEFRQLASSTLGTDVVGAGIEVLAQREAQLAAKAAQKAADESKAAAEAKKTRGEELKALIDLNPALRPRFIGQTPEQISDYFDNMDDEQVRLDFAALQTTAEAEAAAKAAELAAKRVGKELEASAPQQQVLFNAQRTQHRAQVATLAAELNPLVADNIITEEEMPLVRDILTRVQLEQNKWFETVQSARAALGDRFSEAELRYAQTERDFIQSLLSDPARISGNSLKTLASFTALSTANQDLPSRMMLAAQELGGQAAVERMFANKQTGPQLAAALRLSTTDAMGAVDVMNNSTNVLKDIVDARAALGTQAPTEIHLTMDAKALGNTLRSFVLVPTNNYSPSTFAGPYGLVSQLGAQTGMMIAKGMSDSLKAEVGNELVVASRRHLSFVQAYFTKQNPELAGKVSFVLKDDGTFIQGTGLTPSERQLVSTFESKYVNGRAIIRAATTFGVQQPAQRINTASVSQPAPARSETTTAPRTPITSVAEELNSLYGGD